MKTIKQRAKEYSKSMAMIQVHPNFQSEEARECAAELFDNEDVEQAFIVGALETIDELKTVLSVSEDKYLRDNILKMINYLEGKE